MRFCVCTCVCVVFVDLQGNVKGGTSPHCPHAYTTYAESIQSMFCVSFFLRCGSLTHSGSVESSGESQWELLSLVDNTQRGSQQRMIEKLRHTTESYHQQYTGESEMTRMKRGRLERERERAREEKREMEDRARQAEMRVRELERERERDHQRVREAECELQQERERVREVEEERERERQRVREAERNRQQERVQRVQEVERERDRERARARELQQRLEEVERREYEKSVVQEQAIAAEQRGPSWEVKEEELEVTDEELGCGGWAKVKVAKLKVAAKCLHNQLIYDYHRRLFRREMNMAAKVSHPNLLRFLGARLEGDMAILTEFMPTSLRALVNRRPRQCLPLQQLLSIAIDVARALNYLHNMTPDPIIHRDLSSANVLLQPSPDGGWLAKVSDYGTANFQSQLQTENPGSPVYTAPESHDPALQSPKMDIYSFGVLLVEMYTCEWPAPERRAELMEDVDHQGLLGLIRQCLREDRDRRPTAAQLVDLLQVMQ